MINPYQNREKSSLAIKTGERLARWTATITTGIGGAIWGYSQAIKYLPADWTTATPIIASVAAVLVAGVLGWITDHAFGDLLQRVVTDAVSASHPNAVKWNGPAYFRNLRRVESVLFLVVLVGLFAFDAYTTVIIRDPVADEAKQLEITDVAAATNQLSREHSTATAPMASQIASLKADIAATERRVSSDNAALTKLAQEGNAWAKGQLAAKKAKATKNSRQELEKLTAAYNTALSNQSTAIASTEAQIQQQNQQRMEANERNRSIMASMYTWMAFGPKLLSIILRILMVITFFAYSSNLQMDLNGDGIIDYADVEVYYTNLLQRRQQREEAARSARAQRPPLTEHPGATDFT